MTPSEEHFRQYVSDRKERDNPAELKSPHTPLSGEGRSSFQLS